MLKLLLFTTSLIEILTVRTQYINRDKFLRNNFRSNALRVHAGRDADQDEFRYIVSMQLVNDNLTEDAFRTCTGSLVSSTWVLTAAHCTANEIEPSDYIIIRYGDVTAPFNYRTSRYSKVLREEYHPMYRKSNSFRLGYEYLEYDILLMLTEEITLNKVGRLSATQYSALYGLPVQFAGYGDIDLKNLSASENKPLQVGEGGIVPCDNDVLKKYKVKGPVICVISKCSMTNQSVLHGDSGGPLLYDGQIVAVATAILFNKFKTIHISMFYTPISPYISWIQKTIHGK